MSEITTVVCTKGPKAIGPYSTAKIFNNIMFVSGQIPLNPDTMEIVQGGVEAETHQVMKNLQAILEEAGSSLENILKCTIYLIDMEDFATVNKAYGGYFKENPPARVCIAVKELPKKCRVEIDAVAVLQPQRPKTRSVAKNVAQKKVKQV